MIAERVRAYRQERGWSFPRLAEECARLGASQLTIPSLTNIERGQAEDAKRRRRDVTVEELTVLAKALGVPPILLVLPLGTEPTVELLPGYSVPTWAAAKWWSGDGYFPTRTDDGRWVHTVEDRKAYEAGAVALVLFRKHEQVVVDLGNLWISGVDPYDTSPDALGVAQVLGFTSEESRQRAQLTVTRLRDVRESMHSAGLTPPDLPPDLTYIDKEGNG